MNDNKQLGEKGSSCIGIWRRVVEDISITGFALKTGGLQQITLSDFIAQITACEAAEALWIKLLLFD